MNEEAQVKKILTAYRDWVCADQVHLGEYPNACNLDETTHQICQSFPKTEANPDGYKAGMKEVIEASDELLEAGRKAIEDALVEWRDGRLSEFTRGNGLVIREKVGSDSNVIRFGPETALRIGMKAIGQALLKKKGLNDG